MRGTGGEPPGGAGLLHAGQVDLQEALQRIRGTEQGRLQRRPAAPVLHHHDTEPLRQDRHRGSHRHQQHRNGRGREGQPADREADQQIGNPLQDRVVAGQEQVPEEHRGRGQVLPFGVVAQLQRRFGGEEPGPQQEGQRRAHQHPAGGQYQQVFDIQTEERQHAQEQDGVVDQDDRDVHFKPADGQPDGGDHQRPERNTPAGRPQLRSLERLLFAGGQCQSDSGEDSEQGRGATGKHEPHPRGGELGIGLEGGENMGGHHAQKGQPAGRVNPGEPGAGAAGGAASGFASGPAPGGPG